MKIKKLNGDEIECSVEEYIQIQQYKKTQQPIFQQPKSTPVNNKKQYPSNVYRWERKEDSVIKDFFEKPENAQKTDIAIINDIKANGLLPNRTLKAINSRLTFLKNKKKIRAHNNKKTRNVKNKKQNLILELFENDVGLKVIDVTNILQKKGYDVTNHTVGTYLSELKKNNYLETSDFRPYTYYKKGVFAKEHLKFNKFSYMG